MPPRARGASALGVACLALRVAAVPAERHLAPHLSSDAAYIAIRPGGRALLLEAQGGAALRREPRPGEAGALQDDASPISPHIAEEPHSITPAVLLSEAALEASRAGEVGSRPALPQDHRLRDALRKDGELAGDKVLPLLMIKMALASLAVKILAFCTAALFLLNHNGRYLVKGAVPSSTRTKVCCGLAMKAMLLLTAARAYFLVWDAAKMFKALNGGLINDILRQVNEDFLTNAQAIDGGLIHNVSIEVANPLANDLTMLKVDSALRSGDDRGPGVSLSKPVALAPNASGPSGLAVSVPPGTSVVSVLKAAGAGLQPGSAMGLEWRFYADIVLAGRVLSLSGACRLPFKMGLLPALGAWPQALDNNTLAVRESLAVGLQDAHGEGSHVLDISATTVNGPYVEQLCVSLGLLATLAYLLATGLALVAGLTGYERLYGPVVCPEAVDSEESEGAREARATTCPTPTADAAAAPAADAQPAG